MRSGPIVRTALEPVRLKFNTARNFGIEFKRFVLCGLENRESTLRALKISFNNQYAGFGNFVRLTFLEGDLGKAAKFLNDSTFLTKNVFSKEAIRRTSIVKRSLGIENSPFPMVFAMAETGGNSELDLLKKEIGNLEDERKRPLEIARKLRAGINQKKEALKTQLGASFSSLDWEGKLKSDRDLKRAAEKVIELSKKVKELDAQIEVKKARIAEIEAQSAVKKESSPAEIISKLELTASALEQEIIRSELSKEAVQQLNDFLLSAKRALSAAKTYLSPGFEKFFDKRVDDARAQLGKIEKILFPETGEASPGGDVSFERPAAAPPASTSRADFDPFMPSDDTPPLGEPPKLDITRVGGVEPPPAKTGETVVVGAVPAHKSAPPKEITTQSQQFPAGQGNTVTLSPEHYQILKKWQKTYVLRSPDETLQHLLGLMRMLQDAMGSFSKAGLVNLDAGIYSAIPMLQESVENLVSDRGLLSVLAEMLGHKNRTELSSSVETLRGLDSALKKLRESSGKNDIVEVASFAAEAFKEREKLKQGVAEILELMKSIPELMEVPGLAVKLEELRKNPDDSIGPLRTLLVEFPKLWEKHKALTIEFEEIQAIVNFIEAFEDKKDDEQNRLFRETQRKIKDPTAKDLFNFIVKLFAAHKNIKKRIKELELEKTQAGENMEKELAELRAKNQEYSDKIAEQAKALSFVAEYLKLKDENPFSDEKFPTFEEFVAKRTKGEKVEIEDDLEFDPTKAGDDSPENE